MSWDGYKVGGYEKHPQKDPLKDSAWTGLTADDKKRAERRMRLQQIKARRTDVDEEKTLAKKLIEWVRNNVHKSQ
jgi:hypothetical protein